MAAAVKKKAKGRGKTVSGTVKLRFKVPGGRLKVHPAKGVERREPDVRKRRFTFEEVSGILEFIGDLRDCYHGDMENVSATDLAIVVNNNGNEAERTEAFLALLPVVRRMDARLEKVPNDRGNQSGRWIKWHPSMLLDTDKGKEWRAIAYENQPWLASATSNPS